jgi:hypothetical protein
MRRCVVAVVLPVLFLVPALAQEGKLRSGPQVGDLLPGSFHPFNYNGEKAPGRYHCLVCEFRLDPVVLVFARERPDGKNAELLDLLTKLDEAVKRHRDIPLKSFVVFLSPDARSSTTEGKVEEADKLVEEEASREKLTTRLTALAKKLKNVVVTSYPAAGPDKYRIDPQADVTVLVYRKHRVLANYAYPEGGLTAAEVSRIIKGVDALLAGSKKKTALVQHD